MDILFVNETCGWSGGVEHHIAETVRALRLRGHRCRLAWGVESEHDPEAYRRRFDDHFPCRELGHPKGRSFLSIAGRGHDVLYLHNVPRLAPWEPLAGSVRTVRMIHDHDVYCPRRHKYYLWNGRVCSRPAGWHCALDLAFVRRTPGSLLGVSWLNLGEHLRDLRLHHRLDAVLVASQYMASQLRQNGMPSERIHVLAPVIPPPERPPTPVPDEGPVLYVGQLIRGKGVDLLLSALATLSPTVRATIVGTGNARPALERMARKLGLAGRVRFEGWVSPHALGRYYEESSVVVVPSRWPEPFGLVGLEAMARGRPVVAFSVGGIPDWLEHGQTGLLVAEQDVHGMSEAVASLLGDPPLARRLGAQAYRQVRERFSFQGYVERLEAILSLAPAPPLSPRQPVQPAPSQSSIHGRS